MVVALSEEERQIAAGMHGEGAAMAMRIVAESARLLGAPQLIPIASAHIDGALYHGDSGTLFAEKLVAGGGKVAVRATLNVGALDLTGCSHIRLREPKRGMARRMMEAYRALGCETSWTCAPYQAGHRPAFGTDVAWGESNAVVFCNSVLGARTNRYGDFLDIACAITGRAPDCGLHRIENRRAKVKFDVSALDPDFLVSEIAWPVLGSLYGSEIGEAVGIVTGILQNPGEDALKAFGAAAASSGAVGLFHMEGVTPEAKGLSHEATPAFETEIRVTREMARAAQKKLSNAGSPDRLDAVAVGSPHLSLAEFEKLQRLVDGRNLKIPLYACTGRHVLVEIDRLGWRKILESKGVTVVVDTCVVVTPVLKQIEGGVLMTNSGKFAHYAPGNTGYSVLYASLADCVESAVAGEPRFFGPDGMMPAVEGAVLVPGADVTAEALVLTAPISFWGGVDPKSGRIIDVRHPQVGKAVAGRVLFLPGTIGSSSASAVLLELVHAGKAPAALVLHEPDAILLLGLIVAREMGWSAPIAIKLDRMLHDQFDSLVATVHEDGTISA